MQREQLSRMYLDYLKEEGYCPRLDEDGDVIFKCEGRHYAILIDPRDECYFRLVYPNFWAIEDDTARQRAIVAAHDVNSRVKVAKVYVVRDDTWASVEMFCSPPQAFQDVFGRSIGALRAAVRGFLDAVRGDDADDEDADEED